MYITRNSFKFCDRLINLEVGTELFYIKYRKGPELFYTVDRAFL